MKRKIVFKLFVCILVVISMSQTSQYVFAHSSSQEDILAKSYNSFNGGYYIGGDNVGWSIDEGIHTNGTTVTYSFDYLDQLSLSKIPSAKQFKHSHNFNIP